MICARRVTKRYGRHRVLQELSLDVSAGERVALLGLNGAGKTTLMRCLLGLVSFEGDLSIAGCDVRREGRAARSHLGYVPQRAPHFDGTLSEVVEFFARIRSGDRQYVRERLMTFGLSLDEHGNKMMGELSGGMLQKVLLALALGEEIPLLLLDEPTANLDPRARGEFLRAVGKVGGETTILLASHRLADVEAVAHRLVVLHNGLIVFDGSMRDLWQQVGAAVTLWVRVPLEVRDGARDRLQSRYRVPSVVANGTAIGVRVEHGAGADVLVDLRQAGIPVEAFWTENPSLQELLEGILSQGSGRRTES